MSKDDRKVLLRDILQSGRMVVILSIEDFLCIRNGLFDGDGRFRRRNAAWRMDRLSQYFKLEKKNLTGLDKGGSERHDLF